MKIVLMNGGLGNQMAQYCFLRYLELTGGEQCIVDDSSFYGEVVEHNGYELEQVFGIRLRFLSRLLDEALWKQMLQKRDAGKSIPQQLLENGIPLRMIAETDDFSFTGRVEHIAANSFVADLGQAEGDIYYHGYWLHRSWFDSISQQLKKEFQFKTYDEPWNIAYSEQIRKNISVGIHVRRGDFVRLHRSSPLEFYQMAVKKMRDRLEKPVFFLFSDDLDWCEGHFADLGFTVYDRVVFVRGNHGKVAYRDMQLMHECKAMIMDQSSFSYYGYLLSSIPDELIIA